MAVYDAATSRKGQATIPVEVRRMIGLEPGGTVQFVTTPDGEVRVVARKSSLRHLKGLFGPLPAPLDIDEAIAETVARRTDPGRTEPDP
jgi:AbrB family looped-hinge helix DNA binding protein